MIYRHINGFLTFESFPLFVNLLYWLDPFLIFFLLSLFPDVNTLRLNSLSWKQMSIFWFLRPFLVINLSIKVEQAGVFQRLQSREVQTLIHSVLLFQGLSLDYPAVPLCKVSIINTLWRVYLIHLWISIGTEHGSNWGLHILSLSILVTNYNI